MANPIPIGCSVGKIDTSSRSQSQTPPFVFKDSREHDFPIVKFTCRKPGRTCIQIKRYLFDTIPKELQQDPRTLRVETLKVWNLEPDTEGSLVLLEQAARLGQTDGPYVSILALIMSGDGDIRWFYTIMPISPLLASLAESGNITTPLSREPTPDHRVWENAKYRLGGAPLRRRVLNGQEQEEEPDHHCRLYTFLREAFLTAIAIPHHPDYVKALKFTDYSPEIQDPDTALQRIQADEISAHSKDGKDLSDDRYLLELHPAEREIASLIDLHCAEYMLMKREFFLAFYIEIMHTNKDVEVKRQRVKSDRAHASWLERVYEWRSSRARRCIDGWRVLGLLDERKLLAWIRNGGMLQNAHHWVEDDGDGPASRA